MGKIGMVRSLAVAIFMAALAIPAFGQNAPEGNPPAQPGDGNREQRGPDGGGGRNRQWDPAQMRQRMMERMKEALGVSDEELQALQPKIERVTQLQRDAAGGRGMMMFRNRGDRGGDRGGNRGGPDQQPSPIQEKMRELQTLLEKKDASPDQIKAKLGELRDARTKAREELTKAQQDLRELLTQRQEAVMVMMGILE